MDWHINIFLKLKSQPIACSKDEVPTIKLKYKRKQKTGILTCSTDTFFHH
jgi:hypothetical protein